MENAIFESLAPDDVVIDACTNCPEGEDREKLIMDINEDCEINGSNKTKRYTELLELKRKQLTDSMHHKYHFKWYLWLIKSD